MRLGMILLLAAGVLVVFGIGQRVLDRMGLSDKAALLLIAAMFVGGIIPDIAITEQISFNIGGALIPLGLCVWLFFHADTARERWRTLAAVVLTAAAVYFLRMWMPDEPEAIFIDPNYICGIVAAIVAYAIGRSRRGAFVAAVMGTLLADVANAVVLAARGTAYQLRLGGAGLFDVTVLSGLLAVALSEIVGEIFEAIARRRRKRQESEDGGAEREGEKT